MTLDKMLEELEEKRTDDLERDIFGYDVGYYENNNWTTNATDRAFCIYIPVTVGLCSYSYPTG